MAMNRDQVARRRGKVKARISELNQLASKAEADKHWYRSPAFKNYARQDRVDRLIPVTSAEHYANWLASNGRDEQVEALLRSVQDLPDTAGTRVLTPHPARVAIVADSFLYETYEGTAEILYVTAENYQDIAANADVLIVTSTWRGRFNDWHGTYAAHGLLRASVIPKFRDHGVPIIFYSKEDPPNYSRFLPLARDADVIFTSAQEKIADYISDCPGVSFVDSLSFGVNPLIHTPVGSRRHRNQEVLFAGSWLSHKYPQRQVSARALFDGVVSSGRDLLIIDRNSNLRDPKYFYPREYMDHVGPGVNHLDLMKIQRSVDIHLNLNSVTDSGSMYANRVVELQAMGAFVLSNYSLAVNDLYPEVQLIDRPAEVPLVIGNLTGGGLYRAQNDGLRRVWEHDTAWHRMREMLESVNAPVATLNERVAAVPEGETSVLDVRKIAALQTTAMDVMSVDNFQSRCNDYDVVVPISASHEYSATHVRDLLNVFRYADVDIAAKNGTETAGHINSADDHEVTDHAMNAARVALRTRSDDAVLGYWLHSGQIAGRTYNTAPFGAGPKPAETINVLPSRSPRLSVVVPIYNNGKHLVSKCFRSLQRSSIFEDMEILLIDDGSTDHYTVQVVRELGERHPNVKVHLFESGGSGSASRPRNEGLKLASAPYITYLDPDNEALNDGFRVLLDMVQEMKVQFAIGDMIKLAASRRYVANARLLDRNLPVDPVGGRMVVPDALERIKFQPMSIQALVADTEWLRAIGLHQPVGALGQDSLAFQQMLHGARRIATVRLPIHVYYGAVSNSMINTVGTGFYRKYLPLERYRKQWLESEGMLEAYRNLRAGVFYDGWLVDKFNKHVRSEDKYEARELLNELCDIYGIELENIDPLNPESDLRVRPVTIRDRE